jgi:hypothetical protein
MSESLIYKAQVLAEYDAKKAANQLRLVMNDPTTADLRNEWQRLCEKKFDEPCKKVLDLFFTEQESFAEYRKEIRKEGADKCRPLCTFLRDRTIDTAERNMELLAYLIDFQPRPYTRWLSDPERHNRKIEVVTISPKPEGETTTGSPEKPDPVRTGWQRKPLTIAALIMIVLLCSGGWYIMGSSGGGGRSGENVDSLKIVALKKKNAGCMVWIKDHYDTAPCEQAGSGNLIVPLDSDRLVHLKKVPGTDTIKLSDTGHTWYFKVNGRLELFTAAGPYPIDTNRRLLRLTPYMYNKYLHHDRNEQIRR